MLEDEIVPALEKAADLFDESLPHSLATDSTGTVVPSHLSVNLLLASASNHALSI